MDETEVNLHYSILEFVHKDQVLANSCFGHVWEKFKAENIEFQDSSAGKFFRLFTFLLQHKLNIQQLN